MRASGFQGPPPRLQTLVLAAKYRCNRPYLIPAKRDIMHLSASARARRRGECPSGTSPSPAHPYACFSVPAAQKVVENRQLSLGGKVSYKAGCIYTSQQPIRVHVTASARARRRGAGPGGLSPLTCALLSLLLLFTCTSQGCFLHPDIGATGLKWYFSAVGKAPVLAHCWDRQASTGLRRWVV